MDNTTRQMIIFDDGRFYSQTPAGSHMLTDEELDGLKPGYVIMLSDSALFYTTMEFPDAPKRKMSLYISNYLMGSFPAQLCEKFCYISKGDRILIGIFSTDFVQNLEKYEKALSRAAYITSPLAGAYKNNDSFEYSVNGAAVRIDNGLISNEEAVSDPLEPDFTPDPEARLTLPFVKSRGFSMDGYFIPAAVLLACYLIFAAGDYFRLRSHSTKVAKAEQNLTAIYKKAGVDKSKDPYGMLLSLAGKGGDGEKFRTLFILETISKAHNENIITDSIEIKGGNITFQGSSADYTFLEQFKKALSDMTGKDVQIVDTVKKDELINFTLRFDI